MVRPAARAFETPAATPTFQPSTPAWQPMPSQPPAAPLAASLQGPPPAPYQPPQPPAAPQQQPYVAPPQPGAPAYAPPQAAQLGPGQPPAGQYGPPQPPAPQYRAPQATPPQPSFQPPQYGPPPQSAPTYAPPQYPGPQPQYGPPQGPPQNQAPYAGTAYPYAPTSIPQAQPSARPPYGAPGQYAAPQQYGAPPQYAAPQQYAAPPQYAPPQQYGGTPQYTGGYYGPQPGAYGYPPVVQPATKRGFGKFVILLVALLVLVGVAVPVVNALTASPYMNEAYTPPDPDLRPPALPTVKGEADARQAITANALYSQSIPMPTRCVVTAIDLSTAPETQLNDHMSAVIACLMRVWDTTVTKAGYTMPRPPLVIYSTPVSSACGKLTTMNAAYCGSDQKIYYATDLPKAIPTDLRSSRFVVEVIVAHEFGHAVQARTAILSAGHGLEDSASNDAAAREWSRRIELQADCFAGLFIHSVAKSAGMTQQDLDNIAALMISFGDDSLSQSGTVDGSHGTGASRKYWAQLGLASSSLGVCNTFAAPSDEVR